MGHGRDLEHTLDALCTELDQQRIGATGAMSGRVVECRQMVGAVEG